jgi:hypothetical protein
MFFAISVVFAVLYMRKPRVDEGESHEWTDADKKEFKRQMDAQRQSEP